jgi:hypothetical protein
MVRREKMSLFVTYESASGLIIASWATKEKMMKATRIVKRLEKLVYISLHGAKNPGYNMWARGGRFDGRLGSGLTAFFVGMTSSWLM